MFTTRFCPQGRISVNKVALQSADRLDQYLCFVRFRISGASVDDVRYETKMLIRANWLNILFEIAVEPPVILEKDNVYYFHFDVQVMQNVTILIQEFIRFKNQHIRNSPIYSFKSLQNFRGTGLNLMQQP